MVYSLDGDIPPYKQRDYHIRKNYYISYRQHRKRFGDLYLFLGHLFVFLSLVHFTPPDRSISLSFNFNPYHLALKLREPDGKHSVIIAGSSSKRVDKDRELNNPSESFQAPLHACLLYTSDAADEEDSVDLG